MATAQFIQDGNYVDYTPSGDIAAGDLVVQGDLIGIAQGDIPAGKLGALAVTGVFNVPKAAGTSTAITAGTSVYWDEAELVAKADSETGANKLLGKTIAAAGDDDATVRVRLSQ